MNRLLSVLLPSGLAVSAVLAQAPPDPYAAVTAKQAAATPTPAAPAAPAVPAGDIKIHFNDGRVQAASAVKRSGNTLLGTIMLAAGVKGDVGYPIATVKSIEIPEPAGLKSARSLLAAGKPAEALAQVNPVFAAQGDLRAIPGNWWASAANVKVDALLALKRDKEAEILINQLGSLAKDPEQMQSARLALALLWLRGDRKDQALAVFDQAIAESKNPATLARAWRGKGEVLLAKEDYDGAVLAYLRVPIFYANEVAVVPAALLGSARAFRGLGDNDRAQAALDELAQNFPNSPEAAAAKAENEKK